MLIISKKRFTFSLPLYSSEERGKRGELFTANHQSSLARPSRFLKPGRSY
jgi:hypothetical protein